MPEFIFDVQGLQTAFKASAGAVDTAYGILPWLAGCKSFNRLSDRGKQGLTTYWHSGNMPYVSRPVTRSVRVGERLI